MPTYDYECQACSHHFETFQSITAGILRKCPACGRLRLRRLIGSGGGVIFRGSGFYQTDYRSSSYKDQARKESGTGATETSKKSSAGAAAKPEKTDSSAGS
ncbi:MAG: zinc ribbon domain-containing protein [Planctomycetes bacterium]|nr:zinc ribbon domain-containing protein [Planctomycetota bacterium]